MTATAEKYELATPETTGPGSMLFEETTRRLLEVIEERRRDVKVGKRTVSLLERCVVDVGEDDTRKDAKGREVEQDGVWRPMAELRECRVIRKASSPAADA